MSHGAPIAPISSANYSLAIQILDDKPDERFEQRGSGVVAAIDQRQN